MVARISADLLQVNEFELSHKQNIKERQHGEGHVANISLHETKSALLCPWLSDSEVNQQLRGLSCFRPSYSIPLTATQLLHFETPCVCVCVEGTVIKVKSDSSVVKKPK